MNGNKRTMKYLLATLALALAACNSGAHAQFLTPAAGPAQTPNPNNLKITFLGDSWSSGVGVTTSCYPRATMSSASCPSGASIPDDIARDLHAVAYQNLGLGGSYVYDALVTEAPEIDQSANLVIVNIGFNDTNALAGGMSAWIGGQTTINGASSYNSGWNETIVTVPQFYTQLVKKIQQEVPLAKIVVVLPAKPQSIPQYGYSPAPYIWAEGYLYAGIQAQNLTTVDLGDTMSYDGSYFDITGTCETAGIGECAGHPNEAGAAAIATIIANGVH